MISLLLGFMAQMSLAEQVIQTESFWKTRVDITPGMHRQALAITVTKTDENSSLLVLASQDEVSFEFSAYTWEGEYDYAYFEGWALESNAEFTLTIPGDDIKAGKTWEIGVFKDSEVPVEYTLTISTLPAGSCSPDCSYSNECHDSECECILSNSKGENCGLNQFSLAFDEYFFLLAPYEWRFYKLSLPSNLEKVTFKAEKRLGAPYIFVLAEPDDVQQVASMFDYSFYMYFGQVYDYSHTYLVNDEEYWLLSMYCESDVYCDYSFEISGKEQEDSNTIWLVIGLIITVAVLCFSIPLAIILIIRIRGRTARQRVRSGLQEDVLQREFPLKKWEELKRDIQESCTICLEDFDRQAKVRVLACKHVFHGTCIDSWASSRTTCPLCKAEILPTAMNNTFLTESPLQVQQVRLQGNSSRRQEQDVQVENIE